MQYFPANGFTGIQNGSMGQGSGQHGGAARVAPTVQQGTAFGQDGFPQSNGQMGHAMGQNGATGGGHAGPMHPHTPQRQEMHRGTPPPVHHGGFQSSGSRGFGGTSPVAFGANAFSNQPNAQFQGWGSPYAFQNAQIASVQQQAGSCCIPQFQGNVMFGGNGSTAGQAPPCASAGYPQTTQQSMRSGGAQFSTPLGGGHPMGTSMGTQNPSVPGSFGSQQQFSGVSAFGGSSGDILAKAQKVKVAKIKRGSTDEAQNSHMRFNASLRSCGVLKKLKDGTLAVEEEEAVADLVMRWIGDDEEVVSQTRYVLGADCEIGSKMYALVVQYFIDPVNNEATDAEDDLQSFKWSAVVGAADGAALLVELNKLWAIVGKLDPSRRSEPAF